MGVVLFGQRRAKPPFWHRSPLPVADASRIHEAGVMFVTRDEGPKMMAAGWAIWDVAGLHRHQAFELLSDGFRSWQRSGRSTPELEVRFLTEMFERLAPDLPVPEGPVADLPPDVVGRLSTYYTARAWAGSALLVAIDAFDPARRPNWERRVYDAVTRSRVEFVPARAIELACGYAAAHGLPPPWC
jgi:hypothetical protein